MAKAHKGTSVGKGFLMPRPGDLVWPLTTHDSGYRQRVTGVPAVVPMEPFGWGMTGYCGQSPTMTGDWNLWTNPSLGGTGSYRVHAGNKIVTLARTGGAGPFGLELNQAIDTRFSTGTRTTMVIWIRIIKTDASANLVYGFTHNRQDTGAALTSTSQTVALNGLPLGEWLCIPYTRSSTITSNNNASSSSVRFVQITTGVAEIEVYRPEFNYGTVLTPAGGNGDILIAPASSHSVTPVEGCLSFWLTSMRAQTTDAYARPILTIGGRYSDSVAGGGAFLEIRRNELGNNTLTVVVGISSTTTVTLSDTCIDTVSGYCPPKNIKLYWKSGDKLYMKIDDQAEVSVAYTTTFTTWANGGPVGLFINGMFLQSDVMWAPQAPAGTVVMPPGFSFSRASTARYHRNQFGLTTEPVDAVRAAPWFSFSPGTDAANNTMMIEEGTTNIIPVGSDNFVTGWTARAGAVATITPGIAFLDGVTNAYRVQTTGGAETLKYFLGMSAVANGVPYSNSVWARLVSASPTCNVTFNAGSPVALTTTWQQISFSGVGNGVIGNQIRFESSAVGTDIDIYVLAPQSELLTRSTTYHPPQTTRAPDVLTYNPALGNNPYTNESGSVSVLFTAGQKLALTGAPPEDFTLFEIGDAASGNEYLRYYRAASDGKLTVDVRNQGGTVKTTKTASSYNFPAAGHIQAQVSWTGTTVNAWISGTLFSSTVTLDGPFTNMDTAICRFGSDSDGTNYSNSLIHFVTTSSQYRNTQAWAAAATSQPWRDSAGAPFAISNLFMGGVGWTMEDLNRAYHNKMTWYDPYDYKIVVE